MELYAQGDVLIERISRRPKEAEKVKRNGRIVLAYGEVTGHAHAIHDQEVEAFERDGVLYLKVKGAEATVTHEEHAPVTLPRGTYRVRRQREYTPEEIRQVAD